MILNGEPLLLQQRGVVLQNLLQDLLKRNILKEIVLGSALQPGIVEHLGNILLELAAHIVQPGMQVEWDLVRPVIQDHCQQGQRCFRLMRPPLHIFFIILNRFREVSQLETVFPQDSRQQTERFSFLPADRMEQPLLVYGVRVCEKRLKQPLSFPLPPSGVEQYEGKQPQAPQQDHACQSLKCPSVGKPQEQHGETIHGQQRRQPKSVSAQKPPQPLHGATGPSRR